MLKRILLIGALTVILPGSMALAAGPLNQGVQQGAVARGRAFSYNGGNSYYPRSGGTNNSYRSIPSTQPGYTGPQGSGPAYQRYQHLPYYMRAERKALGMFP